MFNSAGISDTTPGDAAAVAGSCGRCLLFFAFFCECVTMSLNLLTPPGIFWRLASAAVLFGLVACGEDAPAPPKPDLTKVTMLEDVSDPEDEQVSLREAIATAQASEEEGAEVTFDAELTGTLTLTAGVLEIPAGAPVIIRGPGRGALTIDAAGNSQVFLNNGADLTLEGMTLRGGQAPQSAKGGGAIELLGGTFAMSGVTIEGAKSARGGALYVGAGVTYSLQDVVFAGNQSTGEGGALYDAGTGAAPTLTAVQFRDNVAAKEGGGLVLLGRGAVLEEVSFTGNMAEQGGAAVIQVKEGELKITKGEFSNNTAMTSGGAVWVRQLDPTARDKGLVLRLQEVNLSQNKALAGQGGAVFAEARTLIEATGSSLVDNTATISGGAIHAVGSVDLRESVVTGNSATAQDSRGGAFFLSDKALENTVKFVNLTLKQNTAAQGGGLFSQEASRLDIEGGVWEANEATSGDGGGMNVAETKESIFRIGSVVMTANKASMGRGGAVFTTEPLTLEQGEMTQNVAAFGGAIYLGQVPLIVRGTQITGNIGQGAGAGVYNDGAGATVSLEGGAVVSGNGAQDFLQPDLVTR